MAEQTIGRVSVKVTPDTSKFREEAKAKLDREEKRLPELNVQLHIKFDQGAIARVTAQAKAVRDAAQAALKDLQLSINVDDRGSVQNAISRIDSEIRKLGEITLPVGLNEADLVAAKSLMQDRLKDIGVDIKVNLDSNASIERAIARINTELDNAKAFDLNVDLNVASLEAAKSLLKENLKSVDAIVTVNLDERASLKSAIARVQTEMGNLKAFDLPVGLNEADLRAAEALLKERLGKVPATISVDFDSAKSIEAAIARVNAELSTIRAVDIRVKLDEASLGAEKARLEARLAEVKANVKPNVDKSAAAEVSVVLKLLTRTRDVVIKPVMSKAALGAISFVSVLSGFDALRQSISDAHSVLFDLFKDMPQIMAMLPAVLGLAGGFLAAAANVVSLAGALAQALPILLALPGIAIGVTVMALAFKDFGKVLPGVTSQFKALQPLISSAFWSQAKGPINELATVLFPVLRSGLEGTAKAVGGFFAAFAGALQGVLGGGVLQGWFNSLNSSVAIFTGFTAPLANIFKIFGDIGSSILPLLAQYMGELTTRFSEFMTSLTGGPGGVQAFAEQTMSAFKGIVEFILSIGNVFGAVFASASAAGAATFGLLAEQLNAFAGWLKSPEIAAGMTALFGAAFDMMTNLFANAGPALKSLLTGLGSVLTTVLPQVGTVLGQVAGMVGAIFRNDAAMAGLTAFVQGVLTGVQLLLPAFIPLSALIAALGPTLGTLAMSIGNVLGSLGPSLTGIITALQPVITLLGGSLIAVLTALEPAIQMLGDAIATALADPALMAGITAIVGAIISLVPILTPLIALGAQLVTALLPLVAAIFTPLAAVITQIVPLFTPLVAVIMEIFNAVTPLIPLLLNLVMQIITPLLPILMQIVNAVLPLLSVGIQVLAAVLGFLIPIFSILLDVILPPLVLILGVVADVISAVLNWAIEQMGKQLDKAKEWIAGFAKTLDGFHVNWSAVWQAISDFFVGIWNGISRFFVGIWNDIGGAVSGGIRNVQAFFTDGMNALQSVASNAWNAVVTFFTEGIGNAVRMVQGLPGQALSALGNLASTLVSAGRNLIQGFIDGITGMAGNIINTIRNVITNALPEFVRNALGIHSPSRVFREFGQNLMQGLALGIEDQGATVMRALRGVMQDVEGVQFKPPAATLGVNPAAYTAAAGAQTPGNTLIYNAAPGSSLGSEEDLFGAIGRARAFGW